jgi:RHS repeat-associated protein
MTFVLIYLLMLFYQVTETPAATNTLTYYYDYRGSTIALTGDNGLPTDRMEYSLYGTMTYHAGSADTPFLFNGGYGVMTDPNGLLYMRARYYSPFLCRFLNPDPSGFAAGLNFYVYANGNPASMTDPMGLDALSENMPSASWDEIPMAQQKQIEDFLGGVANLATFGLANVASSYVTGKDVFGNNNLNVNDAIEQSFQTAALAASMITALPTDGASLEADAVLEGADVGLGDIASGGLQSAAEEGTFVYRGLAQGEDISAGLTARVPGAGNTPISHVAGQRASQWISTTKSLAIAQEKYGQNGIVRINLNKVTSPILDVSGGFPGTPGMISNWAIKDQELLIQDFVPPEAITPIK